MKTRIFQPTCTLVLLFILTNTFLSAQVLDFDPTLEGPWSDVDATTLAVPEVANGSVKLDGKASTGEYGGFEGITVTPGDNAWILDYPGDRSWDGPEDSSFTFWLAQDQDHFYVGVAVKDDVVNSDDPNAAFWKDDSIEIVVDALNDRYDNNTDNSNDPYGGHSYFNFKGRFSIWDDDNNTKTSERWSSAVEWTYGEDGDVYSVGSEVEGGWQLEVRFRKSQFEDPEAGNLLSNGYKMGFNIGLDDDDKQGPGTNGSGDRSQDLELQYWWTNRARLQGWSEIEAQNWESEEIEQGEHLDNYDLVINSAGRLSHGGTGEIVFGGSQEISPSLFFYQYAEGSSYNKFLEIRNPTDSEVDLSGYAFPNQNNGVDDVESFDYWNSFPEGATIAAGGKYIIAHPDADPAIVAVADHLHKYLSNGDDAYALAKGSSEDYVVIDVIGDINGPDPGSGWEVAGISSGTKDHTLIRKPTISGGNPDWAASAGSNTEDSEWIVLDKDVWQLGESKPTISLVNNGDGTVTVTFEGKLQSAPTVNGPWQDVDAESPLILQPDQPATFGRAVSE